jgi:hypothetical protein
MLSLGLWFPTENIDKSSSTRNFFFVKVATARDERMEKRRDDLIADMIVRVSMTRVRVHAHAENAFAELPRAQWL